MIHPYTLKYISEQINEDSIFQDKKRRNEMIRIMIQTMHNLGLTQSADVLSKESKVNLDGDILASFKQSILNADWNKALEYLEKTNTDKESFQRAQQLIVQQKYLELLEQRDTENALRVLREELSALFLDQYYLFRLSSLLVCRNAKEMHEKIGYNGSSLDSRSSLIELIQEQCNIPGMMQPRLMEKLIKDSLIFQTLQCPSHLQNSHQKICLIEDHICCQLQPPQEHIQSAKEHKQEVGFIKFNRQGTVLVSVGLEKDREIIFWKYDPENHKLISPQRLLDKSKQQQGQITCLEFDITDQQLAIGQEDGKILIYNAEKLTLITEIGKQQQLPFVQQIFHQAPVLALAFHPQDNKLYSAGADPYMLVFANNGKDLVKKIPTMKIKDMKFLDNGKYLIMLSASKPLINIFEVQTETILFQIHEEESILSMSISTNEKYLLTNISQKEPELHLWDLEKKEKVNTYKGHTQREYQLGCSFGGNDDMFVVQGCETGTIFIWQTFNSKSITQIKAHHKAVNQITFHPIDKSTMVSCSDDQTIRVWASEPIHQQHKDAQKNSQIQQIIENNDLHEEEEQILMGVRQPGVIGEEHDDLDEVEFHLRHHEDDDDEEDDDDGEEEEEEDDEEDENAADEDDDVEDEEDIYGDNQHNSHMEEEEDDDDDGNEDYDVDQGTEEIDDECSQFDNAQNPQSQH